MNYKYESWEDKDKRIDDLRFGLARVIEKTRYDEYGTFEDVRKRIIALCQEILDKDSNAGRE